MRVRLARRGSQERVAGEWWSTGSEETRGLVELCSHFRAELYEIYFNRLLCVAGRVACSMLLLGVLQPRVYKNSVSSCVVLLCNLHVMCARFCDDGTAVVGN